MLELTPITFGILSMKILGYTRWDDSNSTVGAKGKSPGNAKLCYAKKDQRYTRKYTL